MPTEGRTWLHEKLNNLLIDRALITLTGYADNDEDDAEGDLFSGTAVHKTPGYGRQAQVARGGERPPPFRKPQSLQEEVRRWKTWTVVLEQKNKGGTPHASEGAASTGGNDGGDVASANTQPPLATSLTP